MQAALFIDEPAWDRHHQRLALCMAVSACGLLFLIATLDFPRLFDLPRRVPLELTVILRPAPDARREPGRREAPEAEPLPQTPTQPLPLTEPLPRSVTPAEKAKAPTEAAGIEPRTPAAAAERPEPAASRPATVDAPVDWYVELAEAAAAVGARAAAEPQSMHPEFDELRRIAAERYGKPRTNPPARAWEVEKDPYGRTLLRRGNAHMVLEDRRLFNQYAFETFERHMIFVTIPLGRMPPKNLPWVETIRARYEYMREPDELPPIKPVMDP